MTGKPSRWQKAPLAPESPFAPVLAGLAHNVRQQRRALRCCLGGFLAMLLLVVSGAAALTTLALCGWLLFSAGALALSFHCRRRSEALFACAQALWEPPATAFLDSDEGWQAMDTAPRDGTIIEIRSDYGPAPYFGLFRWTDEQRLSGGLVRRLDTARWVNAQEPILALWNEVGLSWRPTNGAPPHGASGDVRLVDPRRGRP